MTQTQREQSMSWDSAVATHPGFKRDNNEDRYYWDQEEGIFIVADGMGGHAGGEVAATIAVETISEKLKEYKGGDIQQRIRQAITIANEKIFEMAQAYQILQGMACVLTVVVIEDDKIFIGHVGDTRLYLLEFAESTSLSVLNIKKLTRDHSPIGRREDEEGLSEIEAMQHPRRNEVFRDVGSQKRDPDEEDFIGTEERFFDKNTALLLCSDGLTDLVGSARVREIVENTTNSQETVNKLIVEALHKGGKDNVTVLLIANKEFYKALNKIRNTYPKKFDQNVGKNPLANNWQDKLVTGQSGCQAYLEESKEIHQKYNLAKLNSNSQTQEIFIPRNLLDARTERILTPKAHLKPEQTTENEDMLASLLDITAKPDPKALKNLVTPNLSSETKESVNPPSNSLDSFNSFNTLNTSKPTFMEKSIFNIKNITWLLICLSLLTLTIGGNKLYPEIRALLEKTPNTIPTQLLFTKPREIIVNKNSSIAQKDELIFPTITAALEEANPGDTILVEPGEYAETIKLKSKVNLTSRTHYGAIIKAPITKTTNPEKTEEPNIAFLGDGVKDVTLSKFKIEEDNEHPLSIGIRLNKAQNIELQNIKISDTKTSIAIEILSSKEIVLVGNVIDHNSGIGLFIKDSSVISLTEAHITANGYERNKKPGIKIENSDHIKISSGLIAGNEAPEQIEVLKEVNHLDTATANIIPEIKAWKDFWKNRKSIPQKSLDSPSLENNPKSKANKDKEKKNE